jgi:hypothetical protein
MIRSEQEYRSKRALLDDLNRRIDQAPSAKPVFRGIAKLHAEVTKYEMKPLFDTADAVK